MFAGRRDEAEPDSTKAKTTNNGWVAAKLFWHRFSLFDWCLVVIGIIVYAGQMGITPWNRSLELASTNPLINLPYKNPQVPTWLLMVLAIALPILTIAIVMAIQWKLPSARAEAYQAVLTLFMIVVANILSTDAIKKISGRPRPNFLAYSGASYLPNSTNIVYSAPHSDVVDAYQSYPSGHASLSMAGLGFLGFYLYYKLHPVSYAVSGEGSLYNGSSVSQSASASSSDPPTPTIMSLSKPLNTHTGHVLALQQSPNNQLWKSIVCLLPGILAVWVGLTRIIDYWHNYDDVTLGWLLGLFWATFFWRNHFVPYQAFWASANVKRRSDAQAEFDDVALGVGGHGESMAEANLMDIQVPVSSYSPEAAPRIAGAPVQATQTVPVPLGTEAAPTLVQAQAQAQAHAQAMGQSRSPIIVSPHIHGDEVV